MKKSTVISGILATMLLLTGAVAQEASKSLDPPNVTVVEKKWYKDFLPPRDRDSNPFSLNQDYQRQLRAEKAYLERRHDRLPNQTTEEGIPIPAPRPLPASSKSREIYAYQIKVQNNGAKRINLVDWEYQFLDPNTGQLMGSRQIPSKVKIKPGETQVVEVKLFQQPASIVNADQLDKKYRDQFTERVIIHRLEYSDGSTWQRPATP